MDLSPARASALEAAAARLRASDALVALHAQVAATGAAWGKGDAARKLAAALSKQAKA